MATAKVSTSIEIAAPPAAVRSVFMNFASYSQWQPGWSITTHDVNKKPSELRASDKLKVTMHGFTHNPTVVDNDEASFSWVGWLPGILKGTHHFRFTPSKINTAHTTFIQEEDLRALS
ncbi:hypothetical protein HJFPF1_11994 [Paramyrothecium foliicola]|nr:hypothetical protein HJFPF1_11994 [Paramyrothecium foliicola]